MKLLVTVLSPGTGKLTSEDSKSLAAEVRVPSSSGACLGEDGAVATVVQIDRVLSPGIGRPLLRSTTVSGSRVAMAGEALEGEVLRLPLNVAAMLCTSLK